MSNGEHDRNRGERDQGFRNRQTPGSSAGGVENWAPPQQSGGSYRDWEPTRERSSAQMAQRTFNQNLAPQQQGNPLAIAGFVLSLVSIVFFWIPFVNLIL